MAGIGGIAGVSRVAKAAPDGYQFVVGNVGTHAQNQFLFTYPPYDAAVEFTRPPCLSNKPWCSRCVLTSQSTVWTISLLIYEPISRA